jgi:succinate dehydrogenase/fumarate reductase flavoprotein subunit
MVKGLDTDILVIGSGVAGCNTAIEANKRGLNVVVLDKALFVKGGSSRIGRRFIVPSDVYEELYNIPKQQIDLFDFMIRTRYFYDRELGEKIKEAMESSLGYGLELEDLGVQFRRTADGVLWPEPNVGIHSPKADAVGKLILDTLGPEIRRRNITVLEEHMATRLLTNAKGEVVGATALDIATGELVVVRAKSTVLATGTTNTMSVSTPPDTLSGDGYALALRVGAETLDQCQIVWYDYGPGPMIEPKNWRFSIGAWTLKPIGQAGTFRTSDGETVDKRYRHLFPQIDRGGEWILSTARVGQTSATEMREGRPPVTVDYTHIPEVNDWMKRVYWRYDYFEKIGIDPSKDKIHVCISPHTTTGGLRITSETQIYGVPGLYAIGGVSALGTGMTICVASGKWAAEATADRAKEMAMPELDWSQVEEEEAKIHAIRTKKVKDGIRPATLKWQLKELMWEKCGFFKNEKEMTEGMNELLRIEQEELPKMSLDTDTTAFNLGLVEYLEVENLLLCNKIYIESSIKTTETRGTFIRTDYPKPGTRRHVVAKLEDGKPTYTYIQCPPEVMAVILARARQMGLPEGFY